MSDFINTDNDSINQINGKLRHNILKLPNEIKQASGIVIFGRKIRSLVFTTDLAIIKNCDADAVFAVYPFTPQQSISDAIIKHSSMPVFCGIGGGFTKGLRTVSLAKDVECQGAWGVIMNQPISNINLKAVSEAVDIPAIITVINKDADIQARIKAGAEIINVAGGKDTADIVRHVRSIAPKIPIIASGGGRPESILETIAAGANAITYTPPTAQELFKKIMLGYRENPAENNAVPEIAELSTEQKAKLKAMGEHFLHVLDENDKN